MWTVPNLLTVVRLAALPVVIALLRYDYALVAAGIFLVAMLTDCFDGWVARRLEQTSTLGAYLDPVVDKIVILAMLYELAHAQLIHGALPHLFLARELLHNGVRSAAALGGALVGANWMGKTKAVMQNILIVWGLLLAGPLSKILPPWPQMLQASLDVFSWLVLAISLGFFVTFVTWNRKALRGM
jgi:CDP-diacylglycerol--glycerol-3-phosphate 3-phosphatidyltransferase